MTFSRSSAAVIAVILAGGCVVLFVFDPIAMLRGWLTGFVWTTMVPVGSLTLLLIHRITGGEWGEALAPVLEPAAKAILPVALLSLPILISSAHAYRWSDPVMPVSLSGFYMTPPFFALRSLIALVLWSLYAWLPSFSSTPIRAGGGLVLFGVLANIVPVDWVISAAPGFHSSAFGFEFWIAQILASLSLCAILGPQGEERRECRDLSGMLIATLLSLVYFVYIEFVIIWYGNIPEQIAWYITRSISPWWEIGGFAFAIGAGLPFLALLAREVRQSERLLRLVGAGVFVAIALQTLWWIVPNFGIAPLGPALLSLLMMTTLLALWLRWLGLRFEPGVPVAATVAHHA